MAQSVKFEWSLSLARMVNAILYQLPISGIAGWAMQDLTPIVASSAGAAIGALRTDLDAWIAAKSKVEEDHKLEEAEKRLPEGAVILKQPEPAVIALQPKPITREEITHGH